MGQLSQDLPMPCPRDILQPLTEDGAREYVRHFLQLQPEEFLMLCEKLRETAPPLRCEKSFRFNNNCFCAAAGGSSVALCISDVHAGRMAGEAPQQSGSRMIAEQRNSGRTE